MSGRGRSIGGRVVIVVDGTPFVLTAPATLSMFLTAAEDYYERPFIGTFLRLLRYFAFTLSLVLPSLYVALTTFHQEMLPTSLVLSIAAQRRGVPFPAVVEALMRVRVRDPQGGRPPPAAAHRPRCDNRRDTRRRRRSGPGRAGFAFHGSGRWVDRDLLIHGAHLQPGCDDPPGPVPDGAPGRLVRPLRGRRGAFAAAPLEARGLLWATGRIKPEIKGQDLSIGVDVEVQAALGEVQTRVNPVLWEAYARELEATLAAAIRAEIDTALLRCREWEADAFGFGAAVYRRAPAYWSSVESQWASLFKAVPVRIEVDAKVVRSGLVVRGIAK